MSFSIQCPHCGAKLKAKNKLIGKELPCPKCAQSFVVQAPVTPAPGAAATKMDAAPAGNAEWEPLGTNQADLGQMDLGQMELGNLDHGSLGLGAGDLGAGIVGSTDQGSSRSQSSRSLLVPIIAAAVGGSVLLLLLV